MGVSVKSQHLWEFIYDMLNNPAYNPQVLKWENQADGVFRFINSESVANLWGTLKSNENMTYEKLSRAMRYVVGDVCVTSDLRSYVVRIINCYLMKYIGGLGKEESSTFG